GARVLDAVYPGRSFDELLAVVLLGILAEPPDVAVVVLRIEGELGFGQFTLGVVEVVRHQGPHTGDRLHEIGDVDDDLVRNGLTVVLHGRAVIDDPRAGLHRQPFVGDLRRPGELAHVQPR